MPKYCNVTNAGSKCLKLNINTQHATNCFTTSFDAQTSVNLRVRRRQNFVIRLEWCDMIFFIILRERNSKILAAVSSKMVFAEEILRVRIVDFFQQNISLKFVTNFLGLRGTTPHYSDVMTNSLQFYSKKRFSQFRSSSRFIFEEKNIFWHYVAILMWTIVIFKISKRF